MTPEFERRVDQLFVEAKELESFRRTAFLDAACADAPEVRAEVELLLDYLARAKQEAILSPPPLALLVEALAQEPRETPPAHIGPYRIIRELGRGGMGVVYLGVQAVGREQKQVAIKVLKRGLDTDGLLRRFLREQEILTRFSHPHIAALHTSGTTADGRPYFVMEYLEGGVPITPYCDARRLPTRARLELFRTVCAAVQYAHEHYVAHCDLTPGNILVTPDGQVKLLDFGIAKSLQAESAQTLLTGCGPRPMTPEYASPEQLRGEVLTHRCDVYSLGVILYELVTGHRPYRFAGRDPHQIAQVIDKTTLARPSQVIFRQDEVTLADGAAVTLTAEGVSQTRDGTPRRLRRCLAGDVDNVVLGALQKDPARRYASVQALADDIDNHLTGKLVRIRGDSWVYRAVKTFSRPSVYLPVLVSLLLAVFSGWAFTERSRARQEREEAETNFWLAQGILSQLFTYVDESLDQKDTDLLDLQRKMRQELKKYCDQLGAQRPSDPRFQSHMGWIHYRLGYILTELGSYADAIALCQQAVAIFEGPACVDPDLPDHEYALVIRINNRGALALTCDKLGTLYSLIGDDTEAAKSYDKALALSQRLVEDRPAVPLYPYYQNGLARTLNNLGLFNLARGRTKLAERDFQKALALCEALPRDHPDAHDYQAHLAKCYLNLGTLYGKTGLLEAAERAGNEALSRLEVLARDHPCVPRYRAYWAASHVSLGHVYLATCRPEEAEQAFHLALERWKVLAREHSSVRAHQVGLAACHHCLGDLYWAMGRLTEAEQTYDNALAIRKALAGAHPDVPQYQADEAASCMRLGHLYQATGRPKEAVTAWVQALAIWGPLVRAHPAIMEYAAGLAETRRNLRRRMPGLDVWSP